MSASGLDVRTHLLHETLFALGNGYIGQRGTPDEGFSGPRAASTDGTYLNGLFERQPIRYPENAFGLARLNEFMVNVPNGKRVELWVDGERFDPLTGTLLLHERSLDFREGVLRRTVEWISPGGRQVRITSERLVCLQRKHVFALRYRATPVNGDARLTFVSMLDPRQANLAAGDDPRVGSHVSEPPLAVIGEQQDGTGSRLLQRTCQSGITLSSAVEHDWSELGEAEITGETLSGSCLVHRAEVLARMGQPTGFVKYGAYHSSRDHAEGDLAARAGEDLARARLHGFDHLCEEQAAMLAHFWRDADVEIGGDPALQQGLRFNLFHLLQSVGRDGQTNVAAKGVTGEGYEGHYFWDTEIYILPFFLATQPEIARRLLEFRCRLLPKARERARQMAHPRGALYPWRTIAGEECSAYFPAGTAQVHINADIAHALRQYVQVTGDVDFLIKQGAEMLLETARIWMDLGHHDLRRGGAFCIFEVTGPDEYTAMVDNNFYTNAMAQQHLRYAAEVVDLLWHSYGEDYVRIASAIDLQPQEPLAWRRAADAMYLPVDPLLGVHPQDDSLLHKPAWPFPRPTSHKNPLLLNYHPLVIYRHQVCKQADVVLALLLRPELCSLDQKLRDFHFYESITVHDSSLSASVFSILASEIGEHAKAMDYFMQTARMDLDDLHGNTGHGVHMAAMAGTWLGVVHGFGGLRWIDGVPHLRPWLPHGWTHYAFRLRRGDAQAEVRVGRDEVVYRLVGDLPMTLVHDDEPITLLPGTPPEQRALPCRRPLLHKPSSSTSTAS
ncbi:MAG TPA: glycosyl hydrolase family 65 protein [Burkholderiaceae bacterium]